MCFCYPSRERGLVCLQSEGGSVCLLLCCYFILIVASPKTPSSGISLSGPRLKPRAEPSQGPAGLASAPPLRSAAFPRSRKRIFWSATSQN